jgi:NADH-quinone oxidoreductase subunit M
MNLVSSINPLVLMTFFPLIGALVILFIKGQHKNTIRWTALCTALITFIISIYVLSAFDRSGVGFQEEINLPWINMGGLDIRFQM